MLAKKVRKGKGNDGLGGCRKSEYNIYVIFMWKIETLGTRVDRELSKLPPDLFARFLRIAELLEEHGPEIVGMPHVRSLAGTGGLWEMRMSGKDGIARAAFVKAQGQRLVVVHVFKKKTQKTPKTALDTARKRAKEVK